MQGLGADELQWQWMLVLMAMASLAIRQSRRHIPRPACSAYSTISHMGLPAAGVLAANAGGYTAALFYVVTYATTLVAFGLILVLARRGFEAENLDDFKGLNPRWYAFLMLRAMFSMAGVPPAVGFSTLSGAWWRSATCGWPWRPCCSAHWRLWW